MALFIMEDLITEAAPSVLGSNYSPSSEDFFFVFVNAVLPLKCEGQTSLSEWTFCGNDTVMF